LVGNPVFMITSFAIQAHFNAYKNSIENNPKKNGIGIGLDEILMIFWGMFRVDYWGGCGVG